MSEGDHDRGAGVGDGDVVAEGVRGQGRVTVHRERGGQVRHDDGAGDRAVGTAARGAAHTDIGAGDADRVAQDAAVELVGAAGDADLSRAGE